MVNKNHGPSSIFTEIFDETDIYSPKYHQASYNKELLNVQYSDWCDVCLEDIQNMIPVIHDSYAALLDEDNLLDLNIFTICECQTQAHIVLF